tara:strand:- start:87 stop:251 length:165 start_codon:yes stop_codon:yes gene_type:complete
MTKKNEKKKKPKPKKNEKPKPKPKPKPTKNEKNYHIMPDGSKMSGKKHKTHKSY